MRKLHFIFMLFVCAALGHASVGWNFTAPSGEDTAIVINGGSGPSTRGIVVGKNNDINDAIVGVGNNGGRGVLGSDATGLVADGYHSYAAIVANQHGTSIGVAASGYSHGVSAGATGPSNPVGALGEGLGGSQPTGVRGSATTNTGYSWPIGVHGIATTGSQPMNTIGVRAEGVGNNLTSPNDNAYGVYATATNAGGLNYGVYAEGDTYAGYFSGDVNVTGSCNCYPSDEKLKENVKPLAKGLDVVMALKPKTYDMKVNAYKGKLALAKGPQVGMIAQDVEKVMPELVTKVDVPERETKGKDGKTTTVAAMDYKTLNYVGLIPVLVKAIQEQEEKIEALEKKLAAK